MPIIKEYAKIEEMDIPEVEIRVFDDFFIEHRTFFMLAFSFFMFIAVLMTLW